jgi:hypothetical protein
MLKVHKMPLKNQFLTGISTGYNKILSQNEPKLVNRLGFTGECLCVDCCSENYQRKTFTATRIEIFNFSPTKPGVGLVLCARGFDSNRSNFEIETSKSNKLLKIFTS